VYGNGQTVATVGAQHEYGAGVPRRSFLRTPFTAKRDELSTAIAKQFEDVFQRGKKAEQSLGLIGTSPLISARAHSQRGATASGQILRRLPRTLKGAAKC